MQAAFEHSEHRGKARPLPDLTPLLHSELTPDTDPGHRKTPTDSRAPSALLIKCRQQTMLVQCMEPVERLQTCSIASHKRRSTKVWHACKSRRFGRGKRTPYNGRPVHGASQTPSVHSGTIRAPAVLLSCFDHVQDLALCS